MGFYKQSNVVKFDFVLILCFNNYLKRGGAND
jgi:hypothetical protein